jgi:hypothetical protein
MELEVFRLMLITDDGSSSHLLCLTHDIYFYTCLVQIIDCWDIYTEGPSFPYFEAKIAVSFSWGIFNFARKTGTGHGLVPKVANC